MPIKFTPATIKALSHFVKTLDKHPFGAFMLIVMMGAGAVLLAAARLPFATA